MTAIAAIALAAALAPAVPAVRASGWDVLYTVTERRTFFNTIYVTGKDAWVAGGPGLIVVQSDGAVQVHKVDRDVSHIAETPLGVFAVGSRGAVWSIRGGSVREEHHLPGPRTVRDPMTLDWLEPGSMGGRQGVFAFGTALMLFGTGDGTWSPVPETEAHPLRKTLLHDKGAGIKGCGATTWIPLRDGSDAGFLACDDRRTFIGSASLRSHPRLPSECPRPYSAARVAADRIAVACENRKPWVLVETADGWTKKSAPVDIIQIHNAGLCLFAATARSIWRTCDASAATPGAR